MDASDTWDKYVADFEAVASTPRSRWRARQWGETEPALAEVASPPAMVRWAHASSAAEVDAAFVALARLAVDGDGLATLTLLRCLHPGLRRHARVLGGGRPDPELVHELVGLCWERIVTYPVERRPRMVAFNVLWDVRQRWERRNRWRRDAQRHEAGYDDQAETGCGDETERVVERLDALSQARELLGQLRPNYTEVLTRTRLADQDPAEAAAAMGLSRRNLLVARARAQQRCRQLAA